MLARGQGGSVAWVRGPLGRRLVVWREDGGPASLAGAGTLPAKPLALTGGTWLPGLPKWGAGTRPGAVPLLTGGPPPPPQPARSPAFWPLGLLVLGPPAPLCLLAWPRAAHGPLSRPLVQAASLPTRPRRPSPGGRRCVLTCEASLSEALSVQISRGLPPPSAWLWALG